MLRELQDQLKHEDSDLASYAVHNQATKGRAFPESSHPLRTDFQRDRDRVLHSRAFRRLEYKTQVFLNGTGDHLRTRLTHTIEVAAICRTIARALYLNEDLAECIALAHDLGHTPFGHPGERAMNQMMSDHDGFDHNAQALRVVDRLEVKYPDYDGLNLTWEVRTGLVKHRGGESQLDGMPLTPQPSLESQVADLGDDLTYYGHDVDDGLEAGLINEDMLRGIRIWQIASEQARNSGLQEGTERFRGFAIRCLIDMMVRDAVETSDRNIQRLNIASAEDAQMSTGSIVCFSPEFTSMTQELRNFLYHNVYFHPDVMTANDIAVERMCQLFETLVKKPDLMGSQARSRIHTDGVYRAVADYIAGMTDRFAILEFERCCPDYS